LSNLDQSLRNSNQNLKNLDQSLRNSNPNLRNSQQNLSDFHPTRTFLNSTQNFQEFSPKSQEIHQTSPKQIEVIISRSNSVPNLAQSPDQNYEASVQNLADSAFNYQPVNVQLSESLNFQVPSLNFSHFYNQTPPSSFVQPQQQRGLTSDQMTTLNYILSANPKYLNETLNYFLDYYPEIGQNIDRDAVNYVLGSRGVFIQ
jgi:hypothetical protein